MEEVEKRTLIDWSDESHDLMALAPLCCIIKVSYLGKFIIYRSDVDPWWSVARLGVMISNLCDEPPSERFSVCAKMCEHVCSNVEYQENVLGIATLHAEIVEKVKDPQDMFKVHQKWLDMFEQDLNCLNGSFDAKSKQGDENTVSFKKLFVWNTPVEPRIKAKNNTRDRQMAKYPVRRVTAISDNQNKI